MIWINYLIALVVGVVLGFSISNYRNKKLMSAKDLTKELTKTRYELELRQQDLVDHFSRTATLIETINKDHAKLSQHMTKSLSKLVPDLPPQDNPFNNK